MADLTSLEIPVKNTTTGEITMQEFNLGGGTPAWGDVTNKPFSAIGSGLNVSVTGNPDGTLNADIQDVAVASYGTASSSAITEKVLEVNLDQYTLEKYMEQTLTTSTSSATTYTFANAVITANSVIDVYADKWGISLADVESTAGQCIVTVPAQSTAFSLGIRIYIR